MKIVLRSILTLCLVAIVISALSQNAKTSVSYFGGTKIKEIEYEYIIGNSAKVKDLTIRDDKTGLLKERDNSTYSVEEKVPHGFWNEYYRNGKPKAQYRFVNGVRDGEAKEYFEDGTLQRKYRFKTGIIDGELFEYHDNGALQIKSSYINGVRVGSAVVQDPNGNPIMYLTYFEPETRHGRSKLIAGEEAKIAKVLTQIKHSNGKIAEEGYLESYYSQKGFPRYYDNIFHREGVWKEFDEAGLKLSETTYHESRQDGLTTTFYPSGKKKEEMVYKPNTYGDQTISVVDGPYKIYYESGQLAKSGDMRTLVTKSKTNAGELDTEPYNAGDWRRYSEAGKLIEFNSLGRGDELLCEMDEKKIEEQSKISDQLEFVNYKNLSVDKFTKYVRFHYGELMDNQDNIPVADNKPIYDEIRIAAMQVFNEYLGILKSCNDKTCVTDYSNKLNNIMIKLDQLRTDKNLATLSMSVRQYGVKQALKI